MHFPASIVKTRETSRGNNVGESWRTRWMLVAVSGTSLNSLKSVAA